MMKFLFPLKKKISHRERSILLHRRDRSFGAFSSCDNFWVRPKKNDPRSSICKSEYTAYLKKNVNYPFRYASFLYTPYILFSHNTAFNFSDTTFIIHYVYTNRYKGRQKKHRWIIPNLVHNILIHKYFAWTNYMMND